MTVLPLRTALHAVLFALLSLSLASPAFAQFRGWDRPPAEMRATPASRLASRQDDDREGRITVSTFVAQGAAAATLGQGTATAVLLAGESGTGEQEQAVFEAAVIDQLVGAGYDTMAKAGDAAQVAELQIRHAVLELAEAPHKPVSGEMTVGVSNRGSMAGMAVNVDLTKPRKALLSTRLEARIRDHATGEVLWEGRADIVTRDGDERWSPDAIAHSLAEALFDGFPAQAERTIG